MLRSYEPRPIKQLPTLAEFLPHSTTQKDNAHTTTTISITRSKCIGRESNPGLAETVLLRMATANFTTKPPMLESG